MSAMQIPSLVTRLATLHASLTSRLALQPTLLALNGRLELVMSQIELRQEKAASAAPSVRVAATKREGKTYVEGESESEDEGSVEDIVLGSGAEEGSEDDGSDGDDSGSEMDDDDAAALLELEASEGESGESEGDSQDDDGEDSDDDE